MTIEELSQLYWLKREIEMDRRRLAELRAEAYGLKPQNMDGMPRSRKKSDAMAENVMRILALEEAIEGKRVRCIEERHRLETYISGISDSQTRQIFTYRFVAGLSWYQVAHKVGGGNTAEGVRKRVQRYLKNTR